MKKFLSLLFSCLLTVIISKGQEKLGMDQKNRTIFPNLSSSIRGTVTNEKKCPIGSVSVCLVALPEKTSITLGRTNTEGQYFFDQVNPGEYAIQATLIGKKRVTIQPFCIQEAENKCMDPIIISYITPNYPIKDQATNIQLKSKNSSL
jgi:hypothetical protein